MKDQIDKHDIREFRLRGKVVTRFIRLEAKLDQVFTNLIFKNFRSFGYALLNSIKMANKVQLFREPLEFMSEKVGLEINELYKKIDACRIFRNRIAHYMMGETQMDKEGNYINIGILKGDLKSYLKYEIKDLQRFLVDVKFCEEKLWEGEDYGITLKSPQTTIA